QQRDGQPRRCVEHGHQPGSAGEAFDRVVVEAARDLYGDVRHAVDVRRLDVELAAVFRDLEIDDGRHVRAAVAVGGKRVADRLDGNLGRDRRAQRGLVDDL